MFKNVASQSIALFAFDTTTGAPKTGDSANMVFYITKDWGSVTAISSNSGVPTEMDSTNAKGWYKIAVSQTETNADQVVLSGKSSTSNISLVGSLIQTVPANFTTLSVDGSGFVGIQSTSRPGIRKNTALAAFEFIMTDSTTHVPTTGLTVTPTRSIDGGVFGGGALSAITEIGSGVYSVDFAAGDLNGTVITLKCTATGADTLFVTIKTSP